MNPYLEPPEAWDSFHPNFIAACQFALVAQVRPKYIVKSEARLYIHEPPAHERRFFAQTDVGIARPAGVATQPGPAAATIEAPAYGTFPTGIEMDRVRYLEIRDRQTNELVTVIEVLSRANKYAGPDREQYIGKRWELIRSRTHLVEIDLLRGGPKLPLDGLPPCDYHALVKRTEAWPRIGIWPWKLREPMPPIPIPLREPDPDAKLDLKAVLDRVYDEGGYADYIYPGPPEPRLSDEDAAWAAGFVPPAAA
jgi:hypothetical protein